MSATADPHRMMTKQAEALARGWAVLTLVVVSTTVPMVYLQTVVDSDEGPDAVAEEATSLWSGVGEVLLGNQADYGVDGPDGLAGILAPGRLGFALIATGLVLAVAVAVRWLGDGDLAEVAGWKPRAVAAVLAAGVLLVLVGAALLGEPGEDDLRQGMDAAAGLWGPLGVGAALAARPLWHR